MLRLEQFWTPASIALLFIAGGCANRPPTIKCITEQITIAERDSATIKAEASDPDKKDKLTFTWTAASGKLTPQESSALFDSTGLPPGKYTVKAEVRDKKQHVATCSVEVTVEKRKLAPTIACDPGTVNVTEGQSATLRVRASDPNNDPLTYVWSVDGQTLTNNQPEFTFGTTGRSIGVHTVRITATDADAMSASCQFLVTIERRPNRNPAVTLTLDKTQVEAGDTVSASARASDPDGDPLRYSWSIDGQGRPERGSQIQINTAGVAGGGHSVTIMVRDDRDASASDTKSFSVRERIVIPMDRVPPDNIVKARLDEIALKMQQNVRLMVRITGHTDDRGSEKVAERVGMRRAQAAKDYLLEQHHVDVSRIETRSAGKTQPIGDNKTAEGRKENRRVEVELFVP